METISIIITLLIMLTGLVGTFLPFIPGIPLIYACYVGYGLLTGWKAYGAGAVAGWGIVTGIALFLDFYAGSLGARQYGASKYGIWGSLIGAIAGMVTAGFPGLILGPFVGAIAGELLAGRPSPEAIRSGWGTLVGFLAGSLFKLALGIAMIGTFLWWVIF
jgi:uncharacterized protein